jgi:uncharacterized lipoprotein
VTPRQRTLTVTVAACAALGTLSACGSDPTGPRGTPAELATGAATAYMTGLANQSANPETMCELATKANRPNFPYDGGTLAGCITVYQDAFADRQPTATPATVTVGRLRDVPATGTHPAGKEALVTVRKDGPALWRYVLRLAKEDGHWRVAQLHEADDTGNEPAGNPVAQTLGRVA